MELEYQNFRPANDPTADRSPRVSIIDVNCYVSAALPGSHGNFVVNHGLCLNENVKVPGGPSHLQTPRRFKDKGNEDLARLTAEGHIQTLNCVAIDLRELPATGPLHFAGNFVFKHFIRVMMLI